MSLLTAFCKCSYSPNLENCLLIPALVSFSHTRWFNQTKFASVQRQLNIYNFQRICSGTLYGQSTFVIYIVSDKNSQGVVLVGLDKGAYYHEKFVRGKPELAREIRRQAVKGLGPHRGSHRPVTSTPNLYELPYLPVHEASTTTTASLLPTPVRLSCPIDLRRDTTVVSSPNESALGAEIAEFQASRIRTTLLQCLLERQQHQQQLQTLVASTFDTERNTTGPSPLVSLLLENQHNEMIRRRALALAFLRNFH
jgi:HSF-type DNA-binding